MGDLILTESVTSTSITGNYLDMAKHTIQIHAAIFLDRHKINALQAAIISPLKFLFQNMYTVYENLDNHGASFWGSMLTFAFFEGLELPLENIVKIDTGWSWGCVDFLPQMKSGDARVALERFSAIQ